MFMRYLARQRKKEKRETEYHNTSRRSGEKGEELAVEYLGREGYEIIERNFYASKLGEIDIVAKKGGVLHFIEVKSAFGDFDPVHNFTCAKQTKVIRSAYYFLKSRSLDLPFCIDLLLIRGRKAELIENITM